MATKDMRNFDQSILGESRLFEDIFDCTLASGRLLLHTPALGWGVVDLLSRRSYVTCDQNVINTMLRAP
jgi:hypothetical protein